MEVKPVQALDKPDVIVPKLIPRLPRLCLMLEPALEKLCLIPSQVFVMLFLNPSLFFHRLPMAAPITPMPPTTPTAAGEILPRAVASFGNMADSPPVTDPADLTAGTKALIPLVASLKMGATFPPIRRSGPKAETNPPSVASPVPRSWKNPPIPAIIPLPRAARSLVPASISLGALATIASEMAATALSAAAISSGLPPARPSASATRASAPALISCGPRSPATLKMPVSIEVKSEPIWGRLARMPSNSPSRRAPPACISWGAAVKITLASVPTSCAAPAPKAPALRSIPPKRPVINLPEASTRPEDLSTAMVIASERTPPKASARPLMPPCLKASSSCSTMDAAV